MTRQLYSFRLTLARQLIRIAHYGDPAMPWTWLCRLLMRPSKWQWFLQFEDAFAKRYPRWVDFISQENQDAAAFCVLRENVRKQWWHYRPDGPESRRRLDAWAYTALIDALDSWAGGALEARYSQWVRAQQPRPRLRVVNA